MLFRIYNNIILSSPKIVFGVIVAIAMFFAYHIPNFEFSASSDALLLENDQDLKFYRQVKARYGTDDFLIVTYTPKGELFDRSTLNKIKTLQNKISKIPRVAKVTSILNVPLIDSPNLSFADLATHKTNTLDNPDIDIDLAKKELVSSPLYKNLLISSDAKHTAIIIHFQRDEQYNDLLIEKNLLHEKEFSHELSLQDEQKLERIYQNLRNYKKELVKQETLEISTIRSIMSEYRDDATLYLGGIPMIVADSVSFIKNDALIFGIGALFFIIMILIFFFHSIKLVLISLGNCFIIALIMIGLLALMSWPITVVSSNFIAILFIITLAMIIHIIVCYEEISCANPAAQQKDFIHLTLKKITRPCFYTCITTMVAFSSLILSDIRPIIDFAWIMIIGITIAFLISFIFFPVSLLLFQPTYKKRSKNITYLVTSFFTHLVQRRPLFIACSFIILTIFSVIGMTLLTVENRFIDYYKESTEIYQGMSLIDNNFGGTTPLDLVISAPGDFVSDANNFSNIFADEDSISDVTNIGNGYWFNSFMLNKVSEIHNYLDSIPEFGKILSLSTTVEMLEILNNHTPLDGMILNAAYEKSPQYIKDILFKPYISDDGNQIRFSMRVFESSGQLKRNDLLYKINHHLINQLGYEQDQIQITGMLVLYNNILNHLFKSQILSLAMVFASIWVMFFILFRNIKIATLVIIPNIISAFIILGIMGILKIPLDIMTIVVAAISIGIAVDDAIHYTYRFLDEFNKSKDYATAVKQSHLVIGKAMYYTTITITVGFSILMLSNFVPTIYFGLLTGMAMVFALIANMTLLPLLLKLYKS